MLKASRLFWILLLFGAFMAFGNDRAEADTGLASWYGPGFEGALTIEREISGDQQIADIRKGIELLRPLC